MFYNQVILVSVLLGTYHKILFSKLCIIWQCLLTIWILICTIPYHHSIFLCIIFFIMFGYLFNCLLIIWISICINIVSVFYFSSYYIIGYVWVLVELCSSSFNNDIQNEMLASVMCFWCTWWSYCRRKSWMLFMYLKVCSQTVLSKQRSLSGTYTEGCNIWIPNDYFMLYKTMKWSKYLFGSKVVWQIKLE